ncbi:hypothetical protein, partial [Paenibacillus sp. PL2-23]|uniref:hypothetical protein n=1 Tax=Paenibacillus sp. PL2-23 TaxID=2100729 RepID=UPI0030F5392A
PTRGIVIALKNGLVGSTATRDVVVATKAVIRGTIPTRGIVIALKNGLVGSTATRDVVVAKAGG